jgi:hypothetical protein
VGVGAFVASNISDASAMRQVLQFALGVTIASAPVLGADALSGRDAAFIDWGVKFCGGISTDKEHAMVNVANAKAKDDFIQHYAKESSKLATASGAPAAQEKLCSDIKTWYGPLGSRIADLLRWKQEAPLDGNVKAATGDAGKRKGRRPSMQW